MTGVDQTSVPRRFGAGVFAGALPSIGIALTVESTGWYAIGAGAITTISFLGWIGGARFKFARMSQDEPG